MALGRESVEDVYPEDVAKGLAEGNCMSTPAAIANAIADALSVTEVILPATPRRIHALMQKQTDGPRA